MKILNIRDLRGPNVYSHDPVLVMKLDLEDLAGRESYEVPGFIDRLIALLPGLEEHFCGLGRRGGFVERLREGTWFGHIGELVALELTDAAGISVNRGKTVSTDNLRVFLVAVTYKSDAGMHRLLEIAVELVQALVDGREYPLEKELAEVRSIVERTGLGPSTQAIVNAAVAREIPWTRLDNESSLIRLGYGVQSRLVAATISGQTSAVGVDIASDKDLTKKLLGDAGIPVPFGVVVQTADEAAAAWRDIGGAVVVKPLDGNQGRGVSLNLNEEAHVREAFATAQQHSKSVIVEQLFEGRDYRVLVVNGKVVAASEKTPARVFGDGLHTISELIAIANRDERRGDHHSKPLSRIKVDEVMCAYLRRSGLRLDTIPQAGQCVLLRESANLSTGGEARDVTDLIHPDVARMCTRAARIIGLDICGLDVVLPDLSKPLNGSGGIIEVNAAPGIRMHQFPSEGTARDVASEIVSMLFPGGSNGRIPIVAITGTNGKTTTTRMIAHVLAAAGKHVGTTTTDGICVGGHQVARGDMTGPWSARAILSDPAVEVAVLETARGGIVRSGLGFDWADVGVLTNIEVDHIGQDGIESVEDILRIKQLVAERVRPGGTIVLNADDHHLARLPQNPRLSKISRSVVFFSLSSTNPLVISHVKNGGLAFVLHGEWIEQRRPEGDRRIVRVANLPCTVAGTAEFQIANVLAATAACVAMGVDCDTVASAMSTFRNGDNAGRLNIYERNGGLLVLDYGHNPHAIGAVCRMVARWPAESRTAVLGLPGDRSDDLIVTAARTAAAGFDRVVVREDYDLRGREPGAIAQLVAQTIRSSGVADVDIVLDEVEAVRSAVLSMVPGQVVVAFCDRKELVTEMLEGLGAACVDDLHAFFAEARERARIPA
ncbi:MAG TPA: cyanophycin synthetase [Bryobacteraceae bacterium]|nr:cyanophycin synthetase [Bryobacteraceae bacterium]